MAVLREVVGETLRAVRMRQRRTLRSVASEARVSLGYLSEIERGQKEPSSELLAAICAALGVELSELFAEVSQGLLRGEKLAAAAAVGSLAAVPAPIPGSGAARITPAPHAAAGLRRPHGPAVASGVRSVAA